ncbi:hypothetical protein EON65_18825 [archaeon]|nr:MAG: hypothetical protein EON65_18825 [archaeon]
MCNLLQYTSRDAGYTATDAALRRALEYSHCQWLSFTNADNIYGSDIIRKVRGAGGARGTAVRACR